MTRYYGRGYCDLCGVPTPLWQVDGMVRRPDGTIITDPLLCGTDLRKVGEEPAPNRTAADLDAVP